MLILASLPLLAASAFSAPAAQTLQPVSYLPLVIGPSLYRIAFVSSRDGNWGIYMMNADGSNQTRLTNNSANGGRSGRHVERTVKTTLHAGLFGLHPKGGV